MWVAGWVFVGFCWKFAVGQGGLPWDGSLWWVAGGFLGVASFFNLGEISSIYGGKSELVISENILLKIL